MALCGGGADQVLGYEYGKNANINYFIRLCGNIILIKLQLNLINRILPNASIYCQVASHLARFHKLHRRPDFPHGKLDETPSCLIWLERWVQKGLKVNFTDPSQQKVLGSLKASRMQREAEWLRSLISHKHEESHQKGSGFDIVLCHNDCQENNVLYLFTTISVYESFLIPIKGVHFWTCFLPSTNCVENPLMDSLEFEK